MEFSQHAHVNTKNRVQRVSFVNLVVFFFWLSFQKQAYTILLIIDKGGPSQ